MAIAPRRGPQSIHSSIASALGGRRALRSAGIINPNNQHRRHARYAARPLWQWLIWAPVAGRALAQVWWTGMFIAEAPLLWRYAPAVALGHVRWLRHDAPLHRSRAEHVHYANLRW